LFINHHQIIALLPRALNKAKNNCQTQGSASGCLGQPATGTNEQSC